MTEPHFTGPGVGQPTVLDGLLADFGDVDDGLLELPATRPGWVVSYSTEMSYEQYATYARGAQDQLMPGGVNEAVFAGNILVAQCRGFSKEGEPLTDGDKPLTFHSPTLHRLLKAGDATTAARRFYGEGNKPGRFLYVAAQVAAACGYGKDPADPT